MDWVAVEAPLEVWIGGKPATVLMRTPGHDEELVRGFLYSEGIISRAGDVVSLGRPPDLDGPQRGNVISVRLAAGARAPGASTPASEPRRGWSLAAAVAASAPMNGAKAM